MQRRLLRSFFVAFLALVAGMFCLPANARGEIYVANHGTNFQGVFSIGEYTNTGATVNASLIYQGMYQPDSLVLSGSDLYVSDHGTDASAGIGKFSTSGAIENTALISGNNLSAKLNLPSGLAISGSNLFLVNQGTGGIGEYTTSGQIVNANLVSGLSTPNGLAIDATGSDLFVSNFASGTIGEYTTSGTVVNAALISGLHSPTAVAVSGSNVFVYNSFHNSIVGGYGPGTIGEYTTSGAVVNASLITGLPTGVGGLTVFGSDIFVTTNVIQGVSIVTGGGIVGEYTTSGDTVNASLITGLYEPNGIVVTPEPGSAALIAAAGFGLLLRRSRFKGLKDN